ncbi:MAG: pyridoxal-phosphate dependent enzyme [Negativicutes bacterium]|nr:pyridoxal-phosphate dependent enzyme [Negativicutes bacterium]
MKSRLKLENIEQAVGVIDPVFLHTPQFRCEPLEDITECRMLIKIETLNPIRSFKGRGASCFVAKLPTGSTLVCASAGNLGQAMAYVCREKGIKAVVYASVSANPFKIARMQALGAEVRLEGEDFDAAKLAARNFAQLSGATLVEDSLDVETCEGAGTIAIELLKWQEPIDVVLVALGNGALLTGVARWIKAFSPKSEVIGVVAEGAPAMAESFQSGKIVSYAKVNTIADGIAVRTPIPEVLSDMQGTVDKVLVVDDETTIKAMKLLHKHLGIIAEPSGAVGLAAVLNNRELFRGKLVAIIVCGGNLTDEQVNRYWGIR